MAVFKRNPPRIVKDKQVSFTGSNYSHSTIGEVTSKVIPALAEHGFSHRWEVDQSAGEIKVTCALTHELGHSESTTLKAKPDDSGKKNPIQQISSAVSYLERYTLPRRLRSGHARPGRRRR